MTEISCSGFSTELFEVLSRHKGWSPDGQMELLPPVGVAHAETNKKEKIKSTAEQFLPWTSIATGC